jgi:hypothetical protein
MMRIYLSFRHENDDQTGSHDQGSGPAGPATPAPPDTPPGGEVGTSGGTSSSAAVGG